MQLETERLWLRDFIEEDWKAVYAYQVNPHFSKYYDWTNRTENEVRQRILAIIARQQLQPRLDFDLALVSKESGRIAGSCYLHITDPALREANIGYELDHQDWGKGYATEASRRMLSYGFEELGMHRIWSQVIAENLRSGRVLVRLGMRLEGRLREKEFVRDHWYDTLLYAILDHEWDAQ